MTLTSAMLRSKNACASQVALFEREWPNGMPLDESVVPKIVEMGLDVDWFACKFLTDSAWAEYERVRDSALAEYKRVTAPAWAEYKRVEVPAWAEYRRLTVLTALRLYVQEAQS